MEAVGEGRDRVGTGMEEQSDKRHSTTMSVTTSKDCWCDDGFPVGRDGSSTNWTTDSCRSSESCAPRIYLPPY